MLEKAAAKPLALTRRELAGILAWPDAEALFSAAYAVKIREIGRAVSFRGLIEFSNICAKDCFYCGIRKSNAGTNRYRMDADEIVREARWAFDAGYGSIVLQSGEIESEENTEFVENVLRRIRAFGGDGFGVTASLGEQTEETYRRWREAGAHRYLLRIETSNPALYAKLHPASHSWERRRDCLRALRRCGYQVGSGVMAGLPGQTLDDLAADIEFFAAEDLDMIGMGPYVPHSGTPLGKDAPWTPQVRKERLELGLRMIAATRLYLHDVNIAAATALQAIDPEGREKGLLAGANVIMPNMTGARYRADYRLYDGKPCVGEDAETCRDCIGRRIAALGETVLTNARGDSPHWRKRW
ncbi:MAG: [FeFe] hydrogenase H-cluster radical SAM maturase HydE [Kiritimatiellae bacterium]|nr:[FeFe] hydrogenase H-cluster radical SAM maturase HydE [Kiritimatiellia bacterium]